MAQNYLDKVLIGNVVIYPKSLSMFLKKTYYVMRYNPQTEAITFNSNGRAGNFLLFEIRNASYENAEKLALSLGLHGIPSDTTWLKYNLEFDFGDDGSGEAKAIRMLLLDLEIPFITHISEKLSLSDGQYHWSYPNTSFEDIVSMIRDQAQTYHKELNTTP